MNDSENTIQATETADKAMTKAQLQELADKQAAEIAALKAQLAVKAPAAPTFEDTDEGRKAYLNERIPFKAIKDSEHYVDDLVVLVNGQRYQIQRGKVVMIPRYVYMAIDDGERQMADTADIITALVDRAESRIGAM